MILNKHAFYSALYLRLIQKAIMYGWLKNAEVDYQVYAVEYFIGTGPVTPMLCIDFEVDGEPDSLTMALTDLLFDPEWAQALFGTITGYGFDGEFIPSAQVIETVSWRFYQYKILDRWQSHDSDAIAEMLLAFL